MSEIFAATFNLQRSSDLRRVQNIYDALRKKAPKLLLEKPDGTFERKPALIMLAQEVDVNGRNCRGVNAAAAIARSDNYAFVPCMKFDADADEKQRRPASLLPGANIWEYGLAVISPLPIEKVLSVALGPEDESPYWRCYRSQAPGYQEFEPRCALFAKINLGGENLWVINTHLAYTQNRNQVSYIRRQQIINLVDAIKELTDPQKDRILLAGDFNSPLNNPDLKKLNRLLNALQIDRKTYWSEKGNGAWDIDHVFIKNLQQHLKARPSVKRISHFEHALISLRLDTEMPIPELVPTRARMPANNASQELKYNLG